MKSEDFDDAFRDKIDHVKQEDISETEAVKIINYVNRKRKPSDKKSYLLYSLSTLALVITAGLLTWNVVQMNQKRNFETIINSFNHNSTMSSDNKTFAVKKDTVYIKEYMQSASNTGEIKEAQNTIDSQNKLIAYLKNKLSIINTTISSKAENIYSAQGKTSNKVSSDSNINSINLEDDENTNIAYIDKKNDITLLTDNSAINGLTIQTLRSVDSTKDKPVDKNSSLRNFSYQLGIGTHIADDQTSVGILAGINLNKHWNISTGINVLQIDNKNYNDNDDFHYYSKISDTSPISFIGIKQTIYQIPITINYLIPLAKKLSLLLGIGTDLDLYSTQQLDYKIKTSTNQEVEKIENKKSSILVFNNAVISVGINQQWKHFSLQLCPFINPQITSVGYKTPESYYGGRIRLFYNF
jgi:hypothetical protein